MNSAEQQMSSADAVFWKASRYAVIALPIVIFLSFVQQHAINMPFWDDYDAILDFLIQYKRAGLADKMKLLFAQHNEHRIFMSNVAYVAYKGLFGTINFRNIIFIDAGILIGLYLLLVALIRKLLPTFWLVASLALSICIFDINNYENANFAMAGMQNFGIFLLFVGSLFLYSRDSKKYIPFAALLQVISVFSSGNGILCSFFIMLYTLFLRDKAKMYISIACLLIFTPMYYVGYEKPTSGFFTLDPSKFLPYFLHAIGAHFSRTYGLVAGIALMMGHVLVLPVRFKGGFEIKKEALILLIIAAFAFASMGVMAIFRGNMPLAGAYSSRYFIYSHLLVALFFVFLLLKLEGRGPQTTVASAGIVVLLALYAKNYNEGKEGFSWIYHKVKDSLYAYPETGTERARRITTEACQLNIYCIEKERIR